MKFCIRVLHTLCQDYNYCLGSSTITLPFYGFSISMYLIAKLTLKCNIMCIRHGDATIEVG